LSGTAMFVSTGCQVMLCLCPLVVR